MPDLLYDAYRSAAHDSAGVIAAMQASPYGQLPHAGRYLHSMAAIWDAARVYVLTVDALYVVADAAQRLQQTNIPLPMPPALPLWIEFEGQRSLRFEGLPTSFTGVLLYGEEQRVVAQLMGAEQPIGIVYHAGQRSWQSPLIETITPAGQTSRCRADCAVFQRERSKPYALIRSDDVLETDAGFSCPCFALRQDTLTLITAFLAFLTAEGVAREELVAPPPPQPRRRRKEGHCAPPRNPIRYIRLSLSEPRPIRVQRLPSGQIDVQQQPQPEDGEGFYLSREIAKRAHWRLLIAGPGQRWRETRVVLVGRSRPFQRRIKGNHSRYIVEP